MMMIDDIIKYRLKLEESFKFKDYLILVVIHIVRKMEE